jgi:dolichyl-phosphate-mannose--protein O-mannosyl transferase
MRDSATENPATGIFGLLPDWMISLWNYHELIYGFHVNLRSEHPYEASPLGWLVGLRPTAFFYETYSMGTNGCQITEGCSSAITALGNPFIWLGSTAALVYIIYRYVRHRERVLGLVLLGTASLYLPWIVQQLRRKQLLKSKTLANAVTIGFVSLVFGAFVFFYPVNTGMFLPFELWQLRMWLPSWV